MCVYKEDYTDALGCVVHPVGIIVCLKPVILFTLILL